MTGLAQFLLTCWQFNIQSVMQSERLTQHSYRSLVSRAVREIIAIVEDITEAVLQSSLWHTHLVILAGFPTTMYMNTWVLINQTIA